jgi:hypothetical protein
MLETALAAWLAYATPICADKLESLLASPALLGKTEQSIEATTYLVTWNDGARHLSRVVQGEAGVCLVEYQVR